MIYMRTGADHQRKAWEAGGRSSTQRLRGKGPIINARPLRRRADHQRKAPETGARSSTHVLGGQRPIINARRHP